MSEELKPCPFCGLSLLTLHHTSEVAVKLHAMSFGCCECGTRGPQVIVRDYDTARVAAAAKWNALPRHSPLLARLGNRMAEPKPEQSEQGSMPTLIHKMAKLICAHASEKRAGVLELALSVAELALRVYEHEEARNK